MNYHFPKENDSDKHKFYDENCNDYYINLIKALILSTYNSEMADSIEVEGDSPFISFDDRINDCFDKEKFESLFRNNLVKEDLRSKLLYFQETANKIKDHEWYFEEIDLNNDKRWKAINIIANELLEEMGIEQRVFNFY